MPLPTGQPHGAEIESIAASQKAAKKRSFVHEKVKAAREAQIPRRK
jgi:hypothetical protein